VGIDTETISGYTKQNGAVDPMSHAWCASKIDNQWYIFDPTWGSGFVNNGKFVNALTIVILSESSEIIASHMPFDYMWQFYLSHFKSRVL
jgi:transglutaminase/protease-like cytokinesis protein 3